MLANQVFGSFIFPNTRKNLRFISSQLETSSGKYLCGDKLTAADILISFPLIAGKGRLDTFGAWEGGSWAKEFPNIAEYVDMLEAEPGYQKSLEEIKKIDGGFSASL